MKYGIIGTGAIGGFYGGKLARVGADVHFLFHSDYLQVCSSGLQVNSCDGDFLLTGINAYQSPLDMPQCDVVLVCLKTVNNHLLKTLLPPLLKENTLVVLIQNGVGVEQDVEQMFPNIQLAAGLAFICSAKTKPATIDHQCYGSINIGNYNCADRKKVDNVVADFIDAGVEAHSVDYDEARWKKAVWNMPFNGMTVVMGANTSLLISNAAMRALVREQMIEVIHAAEACGVKNIDESFADKMLYNTDSMLPYSPSMKLDYDLHRPMEIHYIYSRPLAMARAANCPMPKLEMLEAQLLFMQERSM